MPTTCQIKFENNPMKVVHSGQSFRGLVQLNLAEAVNVRGIYIHLYGGAISHWRERIKFYKTHSGNEDYLNHRIYFVGGSNDDVLLSAGTYNYDFECELPTDLPTSFEGEFGYIRYTALVVIDNKRSPEKTFREPFTVIREVNLNNNLELRKRIIVENRKMYRRSILLFCWCPDAIKIITRTKVGGFAPGQMINLDMIVDNQSAVPITKFTVHLIRQVTYFKSANKFKSVNEVRKIETSTINKQDSRGCEQYKNKIILVNCEVPPTSPSTTDFTTSNIISVEHLIRIIGITPCCRTNIQIEIPIVIGTLPIRDNIDAETAKQNTNSSSHSNSNRNDASTSDEINDSPIYENEIKQTKGRADKNKFRPKYPVYKRATFYSSRSTPQ